MSKNNKRKPINWNQILAFLFLLIMLFSTIASMLLQ